MSEHEEGFALRIEEIEGAEDSAAIEPVVPPEERGYNTVYNLGEAIVEYDIEQADQAGDALDQRPSLKWSRIAAQAALPSAITAELIAASGTVSPLALAAAGVGVGAASLFNIRKDAQVATSAAWRRQDNRARDTGQYYEIYKHAGHSKTQDVPLSLVWYGPSTLASSYWSTAEHLRKMAEMAKENGIATMHVDANVAHRLPLELRSNDFTSISRIMWREKQLAIGGKKKLISRTPDEWIATIPDEEKQTQEVYDPTTKKDILALKLNAVRPGHPLAAALRNNDLPAKPVNRDPAPYDPIKKAARDAILRRLERLETYPEIVREGIQQGRNVFRHEVFRFESATLSADGKTVTWRTLHGPVNQDTMEALRIPEGEYITNINLPAGAGKERSDTFQASLEIAALRLAHGQPIPLVSGTKQIESEPHRHSDYDSVTILESLDNPKVYGKQANTRRHRGLQILGAAAATGLLYAGLDIAHEQLDARNDRAVRHATTQLAIERNVMPDRITAADAQKRANERSVMLGTWNKFRGIEDTVNFEWSDIASLLPESSSNPTPEEGSFATMSQEEFTVGNVDRSGKKDEEEFHIASFNNANPTGFWASGTAYELRIRSDHEKFADASWIVDTKVNDQDIYFSPKELPQKYLDKPHLKVSRQIFNTKDYGTYQEVGDEEGVYGKGTVSIPVLEGTKPVAATINGLQVTIRKKEDNTYVLQTAAGQKITGELLYWLVEDKSAPQARATRQLTIEGDTRVYGPGITKLDQALQSGDIPPSDGNRTASQIAQEWKYSYTPFTKKQQESWKTMDDFIRDANINKLANCNVANTVANLKNPKENQVIGFLNAGGSQSNALSSFELHQKMTRSDATPSTASAVTGENGRNAKVPEIPYIPLAIIVGGVTTLMQRKRLARVPGKIVTRLDNAIINHKANTFARHGNDAHVAASALAEHALYAGQPVTQEKWDEATERVTKAFPIESHALLERPHIANPDTAAHLSKLAEKLEKPDSQLANQIRKSAKVIQDAYAVLEIREGKREIADRVDRLKHKIGVTTTGIKAASSRLVRTFVHNNLHG